MRGLYRLLCPLLLLAAAGCDNASYKLTLAPAAASMSSQTSQQVTAAVTRNGRSSPIAVDVAFNNTAQCGTIAPLQVTTSSGTGLAATTYTANAPPGNCTDTITATAGNQTATAAITVLVPPVTASADLKNIAGVPTPAVTIDVAADVIQAPPKWTYTITADPPPGKFSQISIVTSRLCTLVSASGLPKIEPASAKPSESRTIDYITNVETSKVTLSCDGGTGGGAHVTVQIGSGRTATDSTGAMLVAGPQ